MSLAKGQSRTRFVFPLSVSLLCMKRVPVPGQTVVDELARRAPRQVNQTTASFLAPPVDADSLPVNARLPDAPLNLPENDLLLFDFLFQKQKPQHTFHTFLDWLVSLVFHLVLVLILVFISVSQVNKKTIEVISQPGLTDDLALTDVFGDGPNDPIEPETQVNPIKVESPVVLDTTPEVVSFFNDTSASMSLAPNLFGSDPVPVSDLASEMGKSFGNELSGRGRNKQMLVASGGGSEGSERAVALALAWLAEHQLPNGSWTFDFASCPTCRGKCSQSGRLSANFGATALGLLPFLGAGNTPYEGKYRSTVKKGIQYLLKHGDRTKVGLSFMDAGSMYSHGLCTIVLCETYAMLPPHEQPRWKPLKKAASDAIKFIEYAQDPVEGGWRYQPRQRGDTSVVGWQLMALKSGQFGGMPVRKNVFKRALNFLVNVVASDSGTCYGYTESGSRDTLATTSIGLLCRIFLDWKLSNKNLLRGADRLLSQGPDFTNPYYVYYATQLFHHLGGTRWQTWNNLTRDALVTSQVLEGHEKGSWFPKKANSHCYVGGRLYVTSLNCMTLEVYYRHLPLYQKQSEETGFPLDNDQAKEEP